MKISDIPFSLLIEWNTDIYVSKEGMKLLQGQCAVNKTAAGVGSVEPGKVRFIDRNIAQAQELLEGEKG